MWFGRHHAAPSPTHQLHCFARYHLNPAGRDSVLSTLGVVVIITTALLLLLLLVAIVVVLVFLPSIVPAAFTPRGRSG